MIYPANFDLQQTYSTFVPQLAPPPSLSNNSYNYFETYWSSCTLIEKQFMNQAIFLILVEEFLHFLSSSIDEPNHAYAY